MNDRYIIHDIYMHNKNFIQVSFSENENCHFGGLTTNVILAAFVTCHGRLKLYSELSKINNRVLYFDTDSIIYISVPGEYEKGFFPHLFNKPETGLNNFQTIQSVKNFNVWVFNVNPGIINNIFNNFK